MKQLVTDFHALPVNKLARYLLTPFSKFDWVWRTQNGTRETTVPITALMDGLRVMFPIGDGTRARQDVRLTYSLGPRGGKRLWFICPTCRRRVGFLYHKNGLPFRCRTCSGLAYPSQYRSRNQSYGRQPRMVSYREQERLSAECAVET